MVAIMVTLLMMMVRSCAKIIGTTVKNVIVAVATN